MYRLSCIKVLIEHLEVNRLDIMSTWTILKQTQKMMNYCVGVGHFAFQAFVNLSFRKMIFGSNSNFHFCSKDQKSNPYFCHTAVGAMENT